MGPIRKRCSINVYGDWAVTSVEGVGSLSVRLRNQRETEAKRGDLGTERDKERDSSTLGVQVALGSPASSLATLSPVLLRPVFGNWGSS